jgi:hypothetical protein
MAYPAAARIKPARFAQCSRFFFKSFMSFLHHRHSTDGWMFFSPRTIGISLPGVKVKPCPSYKIRRRVSGLVEDVKKNTYLGI